MTNPYRAMCEELLDEVAARPLILDRELIDRARALLAEPESIQDRIAAADAAIEASMKRIRALAAPAKADGPAVPDGREPASVALQPSDGEILEIARTVDLLMEDGSTGYLDFADVSHLVVAFARAVLARWGHQPEPPAEGEVAELVVELRRICFDVAPCDADALTRAAGLLAQRHPAPVPVSERLPGPVDCDAEGRCWLGGHQMGNGTPTWLLGYPAWAERFPDVHRFWLPANALPTPEATND